MMDLERIWEYVGKIVAPLIPKGEGAIDDTALIYQPLQHREIRVITLAPGKWNDQLECTLKIVSLDDNPLYETLSYVWGDPSVQRKPVFLQKQLFQVTQSLETALRHLRYQDTERTMWIDAICINQKDDAEKAVQVRQMHLIYARTSHLVIWVGEASEDSDLGMETFRQVGEELKEGSYWDVDLANVSLIKNLPQEGRAFDPKPWVAANRLVRRNWFERVWVIQEVCMPDARMSFLCGSKSVPWDSVSRGSHAIQRYRWGIERTLALFQAGYDYINMEFPVNVVREVWMSQASTAEAECTLLKQLWHFKGRKCGDPRDKVFAILGICKDLKSGDVTVDYSASVARVYSEVSKFIVMRDRSLKLLSACQSYGSDIGDLPSWAPDWSIDARYRPTRPISSWTADGQTDIFNASGSFPARVDISADLQTMSVQGLRVGKISALGTHLGNDGDTEETTDTQKRMFSLFQTWWPLARTHTPDFTRSGERRFDAFWRTIITDMNSFCQKATQSEEGAQFRSWMAVPSTAFEPEDLIAGSLVQENLSFVASFQQATRNRRFFVTEEGHMGLGPRLIKPGDDVYVLLGSQVPFVLRAIGECFVLVGECYCHGVMEGEAVRGLDGCEVVLQEFVLGSSVPTFTSRILDAIRSFSGIFG